MYKLSNFLLKKANSNFNDLKHIYEISITKATIIEITTNCKIPKINFSFIKISEIIDSSCNTMIGK